MDRATIIFRVLSGIASQSENEELAKWLDESAENQSEFRDLKLHWTNLQSARTEKGDSFDIGWRKIKGRVYAKARKQREIQVLVSIVLIFTVAAILTFYFSFSAHGKHLAFNKVRLEEVITSVEDNYGIRIETTNTEALNCLFTGSFSNVEGVDDVIRSISLALDLKYESLDTNRYRLSGNGCPKPH